MKKIVLMLLLGFGVVFGDRCYGEYDKKPTITDEECQKLEKQCDAKDAKACYELSVSLLNEYYDNRGLAHFQDREPVLARLNYEADRWNRRYKITNDKEKYENTKTFKATAWLFEKKRYFLKQACELGYGEACFGLAEWEYKLDYKAHLWGDRENTEKQFIALKQVVESYKKGCDLKHLKSCEELTTIYHPEYGKEYAEVVDQNLTKVDEYWNLSVEYDEENQVLIKGCAENNATACSDLARAYNYGGEWGSVSGQKSKAFEFYTKACDLGSSGGCNSLATFYARDKNIEKFREFIIRSLDNELKERYFDDIQKCQANDGETCDKLGGNIRESGYSCSYRYSKSSFDGDDLWGDECQKIYDIKRNELYQKSCDLKYIKACVKLGDTYEEEKDIAKAVEFFEKACKMDGSQGCVNAGILYQKGDGIKQNVSKAADLYEKACDLKHSAGCYNLALIYQEKGKTSKAKEFYNQACKMGDNGACVNLRKLRIKEDF